MAMLAPIAAEAVLPEVAGAAAAEGAAGAEGGAAAGGGGGKIADVLQNLPAAPNLSKQFTNFMGDVAGGVRQLLGVKGTDVSTEEQEMGNK